MKRNFLILGRPININDKDEVERFAGAACASLPLVISDEQMELLKEEGYLSSQSDDGEVETIYISVAGQSLPAIS